jgi:hypothetical protein
MRIVDFHASLYNLTQMGRHQEESNKIPLIYQIRNGEMAQQQDALRQTRPREVEQPHHEQPVDGQQRQREFRRRRRRKRHPEPGTPDSEHPEGSIIDIDA